MDSKYKYFVIALLVIVLVLVRIYERDLFYDPFLDFFNDASQKKTIPKYEGLKLFFGLLFRFLINSFCTILIIHLLFKDMVYVKFASFLLIAFFLILTLLLFVLMEFTSNSDFVFIFYVRRFLIQPLFLLLFVPAFYYQKSVNKQ